MEHTPHDTRDAVICYLSTNHIIKFIILLQQVSLFYCFSIMYRDILGTSTHGGKREFLYIIGPDSIVTAKLFFFSNNLFAERLKTNVSK